MLDVHVSHWSPTDKRMRSDDEPWARKDMLKCLLSQTYTFLGCSTHPASTATRGGDLPGELGGAQAQSTVSADLRGSPWHHP